MFSDIDTPSLIVDIEKVKRNLKSMADYTKASQCNLRPHVKTHKIPELAKLQLEYGATGITCAKLSEAEVMADAGISDIFIAYPVVGAKKIERVVNLASRIRLIVGVDSEEGALALSEAAQKEGITLEVRMEIDIGLKRTGVPYEKAVSFGKWLNGLPGISLTGIYAYRGLISKNDGADGGDLSGRQEGEELYQVAKRLRDGGIDIRDVSGGSTPTGRYVAKVKGITEIRPGTYIFNDMMQVKNKTVSIEDCAASVLVTVVSTPCDEYAVIDGGSKAFSTDVPLKTAPYFFDGYGSIVGNDDLVFKTLYEEHGIVVSRSGKTGLKPGDRLLIIPNHICPTVNLYNHVYFFEEHQKLRKVNVEARGKLY
ncbi:MAG: alanine racemase [Firmicutes bacterium]|nr:alanine racemase [Bacillota bacterium]